MVIMHFTQKGVSDESRDRAHRAVITSSSGIESARHKGDNSLERMETTTYKLIQPPFRTLHFREMSKRELKEYDHWFHEVVPNRIAELAELVKRSLGFEHWRPDYSPGSLDMLGRWLATQVETRPGTQEELDDIANRFPHPEYVSQKVLTYRTVSLAYDVGMYLGEVLVRNRPSLRWDQVFGSKKFIDYGRPVLVGFRDKIPFNPVGVMFTQVYGLIDKQFSGNRLREIYDARSGKVAS